MDSAALHTTELGLEQHFWAADMLIADDDDVAICKLVGLLLVAAAVAAPQASSVFCHQVMADRQGDRLVASGQKQRSLSKTP